MKDYQGMLKKGFTFVELLITVSLISIISFSLYRALVNGVGIWQRSQQIIVEEDISIFFDKIAQDLRNTMVFSKIPFEGTEYGISFPTIVYMQADKHSGLPQEQRIEQIGKVHYYFDFINDGLFYEQAGYGQVQNYQYEKPRLLIDSIDRVKFRYYYQTETEEISSDSVFESIPSGVEIEVEFSDDKKSGRKMKKFIDIPINS